MDCQVWIYRARVLRTGYRVLGITGLGSALVTVLQLAWIWPLPEVVALTIAVLPVVSGPSETLPALRRYWQWSC